VKPTVVSADVLFEEFRSRLHWEWLAGLGASERRFDEVAVRAARSGADLVGYLNYIHPYRVQILGEREIAYITNATAEDCGRRIARIVTLEPPVLVLHLKRLLPGGKQNAYVQFPLSFEINDFRAQMRDSVNTVWSSASGDGDGDGAIDDGAGTSASAVGAAGGRYQLRAVVVHQGTGSGGHYIAYVSRSDDFPLATRAPVPAPAPAPTPNAVSVAAVADLPGPGISLDTAEALC
jgi:hypothetical protein